MVTTDSRFSLVKETANYFDNQIEDQQQKNIINPFLVIFYIFIQKREKIAFQVIYELIC